MVETTHDYSPQAPTIGLAFQDLQGRSTQIDDLREQLLDELNHRFKNNLQILHGLLLIALHKTDNSEAREVLFQPTHRGDGDRATLVMTSIAALHESAFGTKRTS